MYGWKRIFLACWLACCAAARAEGEPGALATGVLTLPELEALARQHNPTLIQAAAIIDASHAKALQAGLYPNPTIGYVGDQIGANGTAGEMQGAFVQQTIVRGKKLQISRAKYGQEASEAEIQAAAQEMRVVNAVRLQFYRLLALQRMVELNQKLLGNADESLRTHRELYNTGQANQADVLLAEVEANRATIGLRSAENRRRAAWEALRALVGLCDLADSPLDGTLEPEGPAIKWQASLARLMQESPELQAAGAHVQHDQIALQRERVEPIPDVTFQVASGYSYETRNAVAGVQIGIELPLFDRNQGSIRQAQADLMRSNAEVTRVELSLRRRLAESYSRYQTAWETIRLYRESSLPKARQARDIQMDMYRKRRAPWVVVVHLERNLFEMESEYTRSLLELREAEVEINGLLLTEGLQEPQPPTPGGHIEATPKPR